MSAASVVTNVQLVGELPSDRARSLLPPDQNPQDDGGSLLLLSLSVNPNTRRDHQEELFFEEDDRRRREQDPRYRPPLYPSDNEQTLHTLEKQRDKLSRTIERLQRDEAAETDPLLQKVITDRITVLTAERAEIEQRITGELQALVALERQRDVLTAQVDEASVVVQIETGRLQEKQDERDDARTKLRAEQAAVDALQTELEEQQGDLASALIDERIDAIQVCIDSLQRRIATRQQNGVEVAQRRVQALEAEVQQLLQAVAPLEANLQQLQTQRDALNQQIENTKPKAERVEALRALRSALDTELAGVQKARAANQNQIDYQRDRIRDAQRVMEQRHKLFTTANVYTPDGVRKIVANIDRLLKAERSLAKRVATAKRLADEAERTRESLVNEQTSLDTEQQRRTAIEQTLLPAATARVDRLRAELDTVRDEHQRASDKLHAEEKRVDREIACYPDGFEVRARASARALSTMRAKKLETVARKKFIYDLELRQQEETKRVRRIESDRRALNEEINEES